MFRRASSHVAYVFLLAHVLKLVLHLLLTHQLCLPLAFLALTLMLIPQGVHCLTRLLDVGQMILEALVVF